MAASREVVPEGAPAQIFEYFRKNPGHTIRDVIAALSLDLSTAYYGLTRLHDLRVLKRIGRKRPARWEAIEHAIELTAAPVPLVPAAALGPIKLFSSPWVYHFTGTLIGRPGTQMQDFRISQGRSKERDYCRDGNKVDPGGDHPWSYSNRKKQVA
jgi:hypothetical protein